MKHIQSFFSIRSRNLRYFVFFLCFYTTGTQAITVVIYPQSVFDATLDYVVGTFFDADARVEVKVISNGSYQQFINPDPATFLVTLWRAGDSIEVTTFGTARSGPNADASDAGKSQVDMSLNINIRDDPTSGPPDWTKARGAFGYAVDANGTDAYAQVNQHINGTMPFDPQGVPGTLQSSSAITDTLFGDNKNTTDLGTFGDLISDDGFSIWFASSGLDQQPSQAGDFFTRINTSATTEALGSDGSYTTTVSFELQAVPLPAAVWLFGSGLLGLIGIARRKKA